MAPPWTLDFRCQSLPGCYLYFWPTDYKSEIPLTLSLGLLNLLEQLTEHRKPIYSLNYQFLIKVCSLGTAKERDVQERTLTSMPSRHAAALLIFSGSPTWKLLNPIFWFLWLHDMRWLIKSLGIGYWFNFQSLSLPRSQKGATESYNPQGLLHW